MSDEDSDAPVAFEGPEEKKAFWTRAKTIRWIHITAITTASIGAIAAELLGSGIDIKIGAIGLLGMLFSISQIVHKIADNLDHKETLSKAIEEALPLIIAATKGNQEQEAAVKDALQSKNVSKSSAESVKTSADKGTSSNV